MARHQSVRTVSDIAEALDVSRTTAKSLLAMTGLKSLERPLTSKVGMTGRAERSMSLVRWFKKNSREAVGDCLIL